MAKTDEATSEERVRLMLQALLAERFKLALHRETRKLPGFALMVGKGGPKIRDVADAGLSRQFPGASEIRAQQVSMQRFAVLLSNKLGRPVVDRTGLTGVFDIELKWSPNDAVVADTPTEASLCTAIQEQLGLKLERDDAAMEVLVVDRAEKTPVLN